MENKSEKSSFYGVIERFFAVDIPGFMTVLMAAIITTEILGRLILNRSWQGLVDMTENLVVLLAFMSLAGVQAERSHITVDVLAEKLKHKKEGPIVDCVVQALGMLVMGFVFAELVWYMVRAYTTGMTTVTLFWPVWPFAMGMALGVLLFVFRMALQLKESFLKARGFRRSDTGTAVQPQSIETNN